MIKRIVGVFLLAMCIIAMFLSFAGLRQVELSADFLALLKNTNEDLNDFLIAIPEIPRIPKLDEVNGFLVVINLLITFINGISSLINFLIMVVNVVIQLLEFIFLLIRNSITFINNVQEHNSSSEDLSIITSSAYLVL